MSVKEIQAAELVRGVMKKDASGKRDICDAYSARGMKDLVDEIAEKFSGQVDYVASPESMGMILGSALAVKLDIGFIPIRNSSHYPLEKNEAIRASYIDHNDAVRSLQIRKSDRLKGKRILLADDWVGTAATIQACMTIMEEAEASVVGIASVGADYNEATKKMIDTDFLYCWMIKE